MQTTQYHTIRFKRQAQVLHSTCVLLVVVLAYKFLPLPLPPPQVPFYNRCRFFFSFSTTQNTSLLFSSDFCLYTRLFSGSAVSLYLVARYFIYCPSVGFGFTLTHCPNRSPNRHSLLPNTYTILSPPPTSRNYFYFPFWATNC